MTSPRAFQKEKEYTYADYITWDDDVRYELIDGVAYAMAPPSEAHQTVLGELFLQFATYLKGKKCKVLFAPFDVRLNAFKKDTDVFQPDLLVVCDRTKLDGKALLGAPDLAIEVLSPSTAQHDKIKKFNKYLEAGVREYWIVDPVHKIVEVFILEEGRYTLKTYAETDVVTTVVLEDCKINLTDVFS